MTTVYMFAQTSTGEGEPLASLSLKGRSKTVTIDTQDENIKEFLRTQLGLPLKLVGGSRVMPDDKRRWLEALPKATYSQYWFKLISEDEEVSNDNETTEDDPIEVEDDSTDDNGSEGGSGEGDGGGTEDS